MTFNFSEHSLSNNNDSSQDANKALNNLWDLINSRRVTEAVTACQQFNQQYQGNANGWYASSFLYFQLKKFDQALELIGHAIKVDAVTPDWQLHKAHTLLMMANIAEAQTITDALVQHQYQDIEFCAELALVLNKMSNFDQSIEFYQQAIGLLNDQGQETKHKKAQLCFNVASIQRYQGDIDGAKISLNMAISLNKWDFEAYLLRASLNKQTLKENHIAELEELVNQDINNPVGKAQLCYALAKEYEDIANYENSFASLVLGAKCRRENMRYDVSHDIATIKQIIQNFDCSFFTSKSNEQQPVCANNEAIFVLGLPRTGSTLVERIITNHNEVINAGELNNFALQMVEQVKVMVNKLAMPAPKSKLALVSLTKQLDFSKLGQAYIDSTRNNTGQSAHFVDKLPLNSLYVGLIHLALPSAKVIHVKRHPLDTCYAIYKQLFTNGYPFSYDLNELGQYYIAHHQLMQHWQDVLPEGAIYNIAYEDLLDDIENEAKLLMDHCQLPWQAQCIDFEKNTAPSTTASASQVRQGLYKTSQGKWRHFQQQLAPLKAQLEQAGICCD